MSFRSKLAVATGSVVLSALALTGCSAGAQPAVPAPGQVTGNQASPGVGGAAGESSEAAENSGEATGTGESGEVRESGQVINDKPGEIDIRAGQHGSEERVVFDLSTLPELSGGIKLMKHELNEQAPVWGGSGEPVEGMEGKSFLHVYLEAADAARTTAGPESFGLPTAKSAVVNDNSHGTAEMTVGLDAGVDYEVLVEGEKVVINMSRGPLGR
ncbi:hypothetical protein HUO13_25950 [Saccharopolyspora erythraea]|uniref:AMIN-like domain-containing (lipo)protein n=1 Tax=Saccharopolyspora erythraea TaxID=1836 RepID=UPI001BAB7EDD|nr:hypothetical protein [Saccharopolyspora erythraea]QUH03799.1 hypothetical protein HUO13_25950 [Saccharopolyspora erythraea]